jgi:hypothetical protein
MSWAPVAHICNLSYSGSKDQEDLGSKPAPEKQFVRLYLKKKKIITKKWLVE